MGGLEAGFEIEGLTYCLVLEGIRDVVRNPGLGGFLD